MSIEHYENFPVASFLCPPALRPAVVAIYRYARTADDLADEGDDPPAQRLADLAQFRSDLHASGDPAFVSARWPQVFTPLARIRRTHALPLPLFDDLLSAFEQDVVKLSYTDRGELLDYCARSANPVGRLLLHLYGVRSEQALAQSDAICSALQLANFWQDLSVDTARARLYVPLADCQAYGVDPQALLQRVESAASRRLVCALVEWTRLRMLGGAALVHRVPGRAGWELRLVVQGGLRILERVQALDGATLRQRPRLHWHDTFPLVWRALTMRARPRPAQPESA